jgi:hypothetical protein
MARQAYFLHTRPGYGNYQAPVDVFMTVFPERGRIGEALYGSRMLRCTRCGYIADFPTVDKSARAIYEHVMAEHEQWALRGW